MIPFYRGEPDLLCENAGLWVTDRGLWSETVRAVANRTGMSRRLAIPLQPHQPGRLCCSCRRGGSAGPRIFCISIHCDSIVLGREKSKNHRRESAARPRFRPLRQIRDVPVIAFRRGISRWSMGAEGQPYAGRTAVRSTMEIGARRCSRV